MANPPEWFNYHHLRYFWLVAKEGSVSRAAKKLRVSQPTVSEQVHALEDAFGAKLFQRAGRGIEITDAGQTVVRFADEIFALGNDMVDVVKGRALGRAVRLTVGVCDVVPKLVAYRILAPVLELPDRVSVVCQEDSPQRLIAELTSHRLDVVVSDAPSHEPRTESHLLGECGVSIFGARRLATEARIGFPRSLDGAPFLLPTPNTSLRRELDEWFLARTIAPRVVGEFQDTALLSEFAEAGVGLFAAPDAIAKDTGRVRGLVRAGPLKPLRARYYAITAERHLAHPAVALLASAAKRSLFR